MRIFERRSVRPARIPAGEAQEPLRLGVRRPELGGLLEGRLGPRHVARLQRLDRAVEVGVHEVLLDVLVLRVALAEPPRGA